MAGLHLTLSYQQSLQTPMPPMGKLYSHSDYCIPTLPSPSLLLPCSRPYSAPWRAAAGTPLSSVRWLMNGMNCKGEMWKTRRENLTLHDRGSAEAEQGQICLGCVFMHGTALGCIRACSRRESGLKKLLMKINGDAAFHLLLPM